MEESKKEEHEKKRKFGIKKFPRPLARANGGNKE